MSRTLTLEELKAAKYGTVVLYRRHRWFKNRGLDADIVTCDDGHWEFIHKLKWKSCTLIA